MRLIESCEPLLVAPSHISHIPSLMLPLAGCLPEKCLATFIFKHCSNSSEEQPQKNKCISMELCDLKQDHFICKTTNRSIYFL